MSGRQFVVARFPVFVVAAWLVVAVCTAAFPGRLASEAARRPAMTLPASAESSRVAREAGGPAGGPPVVIVWEATSAKRLSARAARRALTGLPRPVGSPGAVTSSADGRSLVCVVTLAEAADAGLGPSLERVRRAAGSLPDSRVRLAGPAAGQADLESSFAGVDGQLLVIALAAVAAILFLVHRSVLLPLVVAASGVVALTLCSAVLYALRSWGVLTVDGQVQGILSVLVIGATTDYGLLLLARYHEHAPEMSPPAAMRTAWRASWAPIAASAATVACAMVALLLSALPANHSLALAGAVAMACCVPAALTFVPAAVLLGPRAMFWPRGPHSGRAGGRGWSLVTALVERRARAVWTVGCALLAGCAALAVLLAPGGLPLGEALTARAPSVRAQSALAAHFPAGTGSPAIVVTGAEGAAGVRERVAGTPGVARAEVVTTRPRTTIAATLDSAPDSRRAQETIARLRADTDGRARVGGYPAQVYDMQRAAERDRTRVLPAVLVIVLLLLLGLLRSLALPVVLVVVAVANFLAALGISAVIFDIAFGSTATEPSLVLFSFVFLIALGVDYNIFLMHRVRRESLLAGQRVGTLRGLRATGNAISSAGVVLAVTFATLTVMPLRYLAQIGVIVAVGVLLDTLFVRPFLVPAFTLDMGPWLWWPTKPPPARRLGNVGEQRSQPEPASV
ncbi:MMPL family transporter [Streptomyces sp. BK022]|uniref:MMPL family transporter n=1 Tax=Streptomyces sp. BK022 TaxID=2512123 RepID=UPI0010297413|nr:MMPL family transporter [Streptomyces sp. BK022]